MFSRLPIEVIEEILAYTELDEIELNNQSIDAKYIRFCKANNFGAVKEMNQRDIYNILIAADIDLDSVVKYSSLIKLNQKL